MIVTNCAPYILYPVMCIILLSRCRLAGRMTTRKTWTGPFGRASSR